MLETLTRAFLFALADGKKLKKGEPLTINNTHGLSIWINENSLKTKLGLGMRNSNKSFMEILDLIPEMAAKCLSSNINGQDIPNKVFHLIVYGIDGSQNRPQVVQSANLGQRPKSKNNGSQIKDIERLWKAPIHGQDEKADKTNFIDYSLLNDIYQSLSTRFSLDQMKALRKSWPTLRQGIEWGDIQKSVQRDSDEPTAENYLAYFSSLAKIMIRRGTICEADFRHLGKGQPGLLWPFDEIRIKAVLISKKSITKKILTEKTSKEDRIKSLEQVQKKHGWYRDTAGKMKNKNW